MNVYHYIRENGNWYNWDMIEIERFEAIDANDAKKRERYWIETLKSSLNCRIECRTQKEWYENNKQILKEKSKEYRDKNKEIIKEKRKEYRQTHKELITKQQKTKYENNKEKYLEKAKEKGKIKVICDCGCEVSHQSLSKHRKSKKHIDLMSMINSTI